MENRNNEVIKAVQLKLINKASANHVWKARDSETDYSIIIEVSPKGEVHFKLSSYKDFPYSEALNMVAHYEAKKLTFNVGKKSMHNSILSRVSGITKVPCNGIRFQIYYLNP